MGVCAQQHRNVIGKYNSLRYICKQFKGGDFNCNGLTCWQLLRNVASVASFIFYVYILCITMALYIDFVINSPGYKSPPTKIINCSPYRTSHAITGLLNNMFLFLFPYFIRKMLLLINRKKCNLSVKRLYENVCKYGMFTCFSYMYTYWIVSINILLIIICNPSITNPGPQQQGSNKGLSVLYHNLRGFLYFDPKRPKSPPILNINKTLDFQAYIFNHEPDVIVLNETWLNNTINNNEIFPNNSYKVFRVDRSPNTHPPDKNNPKKFRRNGGGVLIAVRSDLDIKSHVVKSNCKAEILSIILTTKTKKKICVTTYYRVGSLGVANFSEVRRHLETICKRRDIKKHIVLGDLNLNGIDWDTRITTVELKNKFLDTFSDLNLNQLIDKPTHEHGRTLDLLLCDVPQMISSIHVQEKDEICSSDHFGISFSMNIDCKRLKGKKRKMYNFKKADWESLNFDLRHVQWDSILKFCDPTTAWNKSKAILFQLCDKHIPKLTIKSQFQPPWFDSDIHKLCLKKERLRKKFKCTKNPIDQEKFKMARKIFQRAVQDKMRSNFDDDSDPALISKKFWSHVKSTSNSTRIPETVYYKGRFRNNTNDQADLFNTYFEDQFSDESNYNIGINFKNDNSMDFRITIGDVRYHLSKLNPNKCPGPDGIHGKILKNCATSLAYPLSQLFNTSFKTGHIPEEWKLANVVPVFKKGDKCNVENYRPISLTCLVMKIFEKCIRSEMMDICKGLINEKQHGFLPAKSCTTQLVPFTDNIAQCLNDKSRTDIIYFDFAKAFDSVNHDIILYKLKHQFKIDGVLLKFIVSYLKNRSQRVVIGGSQSNNILVKSGVPQGSILGPLFFVLFINDMHSCIDQHTSIALYADDTKIWRKIVHNYDCSALQNDINSLNSWALKNKMKFHPDKCKVLSITDERILHILPFDRFPYCIGKTCLDYVNCEKDLGVYVNNKLNWSLQCSTLTTKATNMLNLVRRTCHFTKNQAQKRVLYLTLVRSQFEHCSVIWRPTQETLIAKIEAVQRRAVKWILAEQYQSYLPEIYLDKLYNLDLLPMKEKFLYTDLSLFHKIINNKICISMPEYIRLVTMEEIESRLRHSHLDPLCFKHDLGPCKQVFNNSFFPRTYMAWNWLPIEIKMIENYDTFQSKLKEHLWTTLREKPD